MKNNSPWPSGISPVDHRCVAIVGNIPRNESPGSTQTLQIEWEMHYRADQIPTRIRLGREQWLLRPRTWCRGIRQLEVPATSVWTPRQPQFPHRFAVASHTVQVNLEDMGCVHLLFPGSHSLRLFTLVQTSTESDAILPTRVFGASLQSTSFSSLNHVPPSPKNPCLPSLKGHWT